MKQNKQKSSHKDIRCQTALEQLAVLRATGAIHIPALRRLWQITNSPLGGGKYADEAQAQLGQILAPIKLAAQFKPPRQLFIPTVPKEVAIVLGLECGTKRPLIIHRNALAHTLVVGATSMGKSRLIFSIIEQLMKQNSAVE